MVFGLLFWFGLDLLLFISLDVIWVRVDETLDHFRATNILKIIIFDDSLPCNPRMIEKVFPFYPIIGRSLQQSPQQIL